MKQVVVAIMGATGAVGQEMVNVLEEKNLPVKELRLLASARSAGKTMAFKGEEILIQELNEENLQGVDILLSAVENDVSEIWSPIAVKAGAVVIDNSSAYRMEEEVPLVVPECNPEDAFGHKGIIANPNCSTTIALTAVAALHRYAGIKRMIVSTYQAVSGAGVAGIQELENQVTALSQGKETQVGIFPYQIAYNLIPQIGGFDEEGYSSEEMKMQNEGRKILHAPDLKVNCTCIRVPVIRSHSESITLEFEKEITPEKARELLKDAPGVRLVDDPENKKYPMPLDTSGQDLIFVGRIRKDISATDGKSLTLWCCGDQVRKGAATNAVQIAELLLKG